MLPSVFRKFRSLSGSKSHTAKSISRIVIQNSPLLLSDPAEGRKFFLGILAETSKNEVFEAPKARRRRKFLGISMVLLRIPPLVIVQKITRGGGILNNNPTDYFFAIDLLIDIPV